MCVFLLSRAAFAFIRAEIIDGLTSADPATLALTAAFGVLFAALIPYLSSLGLEGSNLHESVSAIPGSIHGECGLVMHLTPPTCQHQYSAEVSFNSPC